MIRQLDEKDVAVLRSSVNISSLGSIVLELVHNSLDAGANVIHVLVNCIDLHMEVSDNGSGISPTDLRGFVGQKRHASSKRINGGTFGFRGEGTSS